MLDEKPPLDEALLVHYGIKGMKWGARKGKSVTGVSRHRGALLDRNARAQHRYRTAIKGTPEARMRDRAMVGVGRTLLGKKRVQRIFEKDMKKLNEQNQRLKAGKLKFRDRADLFLNVPLSDLVISNRPK
jgi:hypothetical protein